METSVLWAVLGLAVVAAASPVLAGWSVTLAGDPSRTWWRPQAVRRSEVAAVGAVAVLLAAAALPASPRVAWLVLAAGGAVLCVVDVRTHRLPLPLTAGLAATELVVLVAAAAVAAEPGRLGRASLAAAAVTAGWLVLAFAVPSSLGFGDVLVAGLCGGLLGWSGWSTVIAGQAAAWLLAVPLAVVVAIANPAERGRKMHVPLGPAIMAGAIVAAGWL
jgi:leader peptidase (prepilin peptidase)/N-methyltransferase